VEPLKPRRAPLTDVIEMRKDFGGGGEMLDVLPALVICAEGEHREKLMRAIRECGLRPVRCCSQSEALLLLDRQYFSVVFCNDTLPDGDFRAIINEARKSSADVPVIILSQRADWDAYLGAIGAGAFDYITCPPDSAETKRALWSAISSRLRRPALAAASATADKKGVTV